MSYLLVGLGAAVGASLRFAISQWRGARIGTLIVNLIGSFLLGCFSSLSLSGSQLALLGAGLCGGLTTFSAFAVQANEVGATNVRQGQVYVAVTIIGSLLACLVGFQLFANV